MSNTIIYAFEDAWQQALVPRPPDLDTFVPPDHPQRRELLALLMPIDQEYRHKHHLPVPLDYYLEQFPELVENFTLLLELVRSDQQRRRQQDERPDVEEYAQRFPQWADRLRQELQPPAGADTLAESVWEQTALPPVPGYEILETLGRGGMGIVVKARHLKLNRLVALKRIKAGLFATGDLLHRFLREAEVVARVNHPHVVQIYEVGESGGLPFFAMEFCPGGSLSDQLRTRGLLSPREAAQLLTQLTLGVYAAHEQGVIHRDLKPANVLFDRDGTPRIADFGLAHQTEAAESMTQTGLIVGTPGYLAPEQVGLSNQASSPQADVYSLGAILYQCLTGKPPHQGANVLETVQMAIEKEPVPLRTHNSSIPRDLETICLKCLEKEPGKRYHSAQQLGIDLHRFLRGEPIEARPVGPLVRIAKWARRRPAAAALGALVLLLVLVGLPFVTVLWLTAEAAGTEATFQGGLAKTESAKAKRLLAESHYQLVQLHMARGNWNQAEQECRKALVAGHPDPVGVQLDQAQALLALNRPGAAEELLRPLQDHVELPRHRGRLALFQGELLLGQDNDRALALLREAMQAGLNDPADQAYARGLLAEKGEDARRFFDEARALRPLHHGANLMLVPTLFWLGRTAAARQRLEFVKQFFPADDNTRLWDVLLRAVEKPHASLDEIMAPGVGRFAGQDLALLRVGALCFQQLQRLDEVLGQPQKVQALVLKELMRQPELLPIVAKQDPLLIPGLQKATPLLTKAFGRLGPNLKTLLLVGAVGNKEGREVFLRNLDDARKVLPEGTLHLIRGLLLNGQADFARAIPDLEQAAARPSFSAARLIALQYLASCEWQLSLGKLLPLDRQFHRQNAITHIRTLLTEGLLDRLAYRSNYLDFAQMAWQESEYLLARNVIAVWETKVPMDKELPLMRCRIDLGEGRFEAALANARRALELFPDPKSPQHREAQAGIREAQRKLRQAVQKLPTNP